MRLISAIQSIDRLYLYTVNWWTVSVTVWEFSWKKWDWYLRAPTDTSHEDINVSLRWLGHFSPLHFSSLVFWFGRELWFGCVVISRKPLCVVTCVFYWCFVCERFLLITESPKTPGHYRYLIWVLVLVFLFTMGDCVCICAGVDHDFFFFGYERGPWVSVV